MRIDITVIHTHKNDIFDVYFNRLVSYSANDLTMLLSSVEMNKDNNSEEF
ncbi:hypothetical protein [Pseudoalteromonas aurantia]|uniref:Uncharacterized protein n=1 Tax=Pseudoalteromonas aurantia 208 TaxID=1314867 RepID=A0ABR9EAI9_9GAMM|nr:hypothetical protein [Pseudoalteromonas aurantia]MBE0367988.1 hypothetical protein [Pseudoalteromonas aurantia 208]